MSREIVPETGLALRDVRELGKQFTFLAGSLSAVILPIAIGSVAQGAVVQDGSGRLLFLLAIPVIAFVVGRCFARCTPADYIVLYPDRVELPRHRSPPRKILWREVESLRWPSAGGDNTDVWITLPKSQDWQIGIATIGLRNVSQVDRATLIRYLRIAAASVEQSRWTVYCRKRAIPLVEQLQRAQTGGLPNLPDSPPVAGLVRAVGFRDRHPFLGGVLAPLYVALVLPRLASRATWWLTALLLTISGVVNIRLVWGVWAQPFTAMVFGAAAAMFVFGLWSRGNRRPAVATDRLSTFGVVACFTAALVGLPLLGNAMALRWLQLPPGVASLLLMSFPFLLFLPGLAHVVGNRRRDKRASSGLEAEALRRWESYMATGVLPPSAMERTS